MYKFTILVLVVLLAAVCAQAGTFVSFNGKFHITYPESWYRIDFQTADFYLAHGDPDAGVNFEVVLHERATRTLFQGQYLVLTVDTTGLLQAGQIDSVLAGMEKEFGRPLKKVARDAFLTAPDTGVIFFDEEDSVAAIENQVSGDDLGSRTNLLVMKFFEGGIANFYFYAPSHEYSASLPLYRDIVASFSTQNMDAALAAATEPVEVADIDQDGGSSVANYLIIFAGLALILIVILIVRLRSGSKKA